MYAIKLTHSKTGAKGYVRRNWRDLILDSRADVRMWKTRRGAENHLARGGYSKLGWTGEVVELRYPAWT